MSTKDSKPAKPKPEEDLYGRYLALPDGPRPPNYYQLLELELFFSEPDRIKSSARKQFRRIKPYEDHPNRDTREAIQDIMTEISTARVVLCDPEAKQEYDRSLAEEMGIDLDQYLADQTAVPVPDCVLRITAGPDMVREQLELLENKPTTIGSDAHCALTLPSARTAKLHCQIEYRDREWILRHIGKDGPTLVNDHRVEEFVLDDWDSVDVGGYRLRFIRLPERKPKEKLPPPVSLIVRRGPSIPAPVLNALGGESILIGHCETALWQLPAALVSRHHCRVQPRGDQWEVEDLRSTNGVLINGEKVTKAILQDRDELGIGQFEILVSIRR